jgi:hypothetical protein
VIIIDGFGRLWTENLAVYSKKPVEPEWPSLYSDRAMHNEQADISPGYPARANICRSSEIFRLAVAVTQNSVQVITWVFAGEGKGAQACSRLTHIDVVPILKTFITLRTTPILY